MKNANNTPTTSCCSKRRDKIKLAIICFFLLIGTANVFAQTAFKSISKSAATLSANDKIILVSGPMAIDSGDTVTLRVDYEVSQARDITCYFQLYEAPWTVYDSVTNSVNAGVGTTNCILNIPSDMRSGDNYHYKAIITPTGLDWRNAIDEQSLNPVTLTSVGTENRVISVSGSSPVIQGGTVMVAVEYEAIETSDLICIFQLNETPWTEYASVTKSISGGFGIENCSLDIPINTTEGINYQYQVMMMPTGVNNWNDRLSNMNQSPIEVVSTLFSEDIRLNQEGYFKSGEKLVSVKMPMPPVAECPEAPAGTGGDFYIKSPDLSTTHFSGLFTAPKCWEYSKEYIAAIDFTAFDTAGEYVVDIPGIGYSHVFKINKLLALEPLRTSLKAYYYMRNSSPVTVEHGGQWARNAGHPDTAVEVHPSAASSARPAGTIISAPKGWYDAGDYNKYMVNSGISTYTLLAAYEQFPDLFDNLNTNIPESSNNIPDILDEAKWNLDWMLDMQDPNDGGVYSKLTSAQFDGVVMPENGQSAPRYVIQKSTASALNFAAVMAVAARVYKQVDATYASQCLTAAQAAWNWARSNPEVYYNQSEVNNMFDPDIATGTYQDINIDDELIWAAAELYITTNDDSYYTSIDWSLILSREIPNWPHVDFLPIYSLLLHKDDLTAVGASDIQFLQDKLISKADDIRDYYETSAHRSPSGYDWRSFVWGGNGITANMGVLLIKAYYLTGDNTHLNAAIGSFDYLLGRNATSYSFVTGVGDKPPMFPHHRPSQADDVVEPIPGMLVGGPTRTNPDNCLYPGQEPATSYLDSYCSYSTNEIAINWNAPFVFLSAALQNHFSFGNDSNDIIFSNSFE